MAAVLSTSRKTHGSSDFRMTTSRDHFMVYLDGQAAAGVVPKLAEKLLHGNRIGQRLALAVEGDLEHLGGSAWGIHGTDPWSDGRS